jgi:hypothetical protein
MKQFILTLATIVFATTSLFALEPVSVIVKNSTGQDMKAQLVDYSNSGSPTTLFTENLPDRTPNSSGLVVFIIGSDSSAWEDIEADDVTAYYVVNILDNADKIIAQYRLDGLVAASASTGAISGDLTVGGNAKIEGFLSLSDADEFTDQTEWQGLTGNIFVYTGDTTGTDRTFYLDDLSSDIPDNTIIYIVNNANPDDPSDADMLTINFAEDAELPVFPQSAFSIMKVNGAYFPLVTFFLGG